jgi:hypothetical protein
LTTRAPTTKRVPPIDGIPAVTSGAVPAKPVPMNAMKRRYDFYRTARRVPENRGVLRRHIMAPLIGEIPSRVPGLASIDQYVRERVFVQDLQLLNEVLGRTACSGRYWVWSGMLLGWAREGRILRHDLRDADFAYAGEDEQLIRDGLDSLVRAGFRRGFSLPNNAGVLTEHTVIRHGARFEFFRMSPIESHWEYHVYGTHERRPIQLTARVPQQELERFDFLGRSWMKPLDHDAELTLLYGDWRTPDTNWNYLDQGGVVRRDEWTGG